MTTARIEKIKHGQMADFSETEFPTLVYGIADIFDLAVNRPGTAFGFINHGHVDFFADDRRVRVEEAHSFSIPVSRQLLCRPSYPVYGFFAFRLDYEGLPTVVGPLRGARGRLKYIDGCSDTLLISPPLKGDPCFNLLHFPGGIDQTKHTHPSIRVGMIHYGRGRCSTEEGEQTLFPGSLFILAPDAIHAFHTDPGMDMTLTVYHPDSDFGPTHEEHPMLNRTIVDGVSARERPDIQTQELR